MHTMMTSNRIDAEKKFRKSRRWLFALLILLIPFTVVASKLSDVLHSDLVFGLTEAVFMIGFGVVSIWVYVAYVRLTGKYPFYFRK
jgi:undecaprenyl pyrophosphate phosphatase UppP